MSKSNTKIEVLEKVVFSGHATNVVTDRSFRSAYSPPLVFEFGKVSQTTSGGE